MGCSQSNNNKDVTDIIELKNNAIIESKVMNELTNKEVLNDNAKDVEIRLENEYNVEGKKVELKETNDNNVMISREQSIADTQEVVNVNCESTKAYITVLEIANEEVDDDESENESTPIPSTGAIPIVGKLDHTEVIITNTANDQTHCKRIESISPSLPPPLMQGFLMKLGHIHKNWKNRYFVIMNGELRYFQIPSNTSPYGINMKGEYMYLEKYTLITDKSQMPNSIQLILDTNCVYYIYLHVPSLNIDKEGKSQAPGNMYPELLLKCMNEESYTVWCAALTCHLRYKQRISIK